MARAEESQVNDVIAQPDWASLPEHLPCARCGYNLRGVESARCPECGAEFEWGQVIAEARRRDESKLFEHQWRRRPVRSFVGTAWLLMRPWRFWGDKGLDERCRVGAVAVQAVLLALLLSACVVLSEDWLNLVSYYRIQLRRFHGVWGYAWNSTNLAFVRDWFIGLLSVHGRFLALAVLMGLTSLVFWRTRRGYGLGIREVARLVLYGAMSGMMYGCVIYVVLGWTDLIRLGRFTWLKYLGNERLSWDVATAVGCAAVAIGLHLRHRVKRGFAMVLLILVMQNAALLALVVTSMVWYDSYWNPVTRFVGHTGLQAWFH